MFSRKPSTMRPTTNASASNDGDPRTPVVMTRTKAIPTEAECTSMNDLLVRLETGDMDLQSQLDILKNSNILCGCETKTK